MAAPDTLKDLLIKRELLDAAAFAQVEEQARRSRRTLEEVLIDQGVVDELTLSTTIAESYGVPFVNLREKILDSKIVRRIPETLARNKRLILYDLRDNQGYLAMGNPQDPETVNAISRSVGVPLQVGYATDRAIGEALRHYQSDLHQAFADLIQKNVSIVGEKAEKFTSEDLPVAQIVEMIVKYAYQSHASDIHSEPMAQEVAVRFRIDGVLHDVVSVPSSIYTLIIARVKVLARLRTDEHFAAQDGKIRMDVTEEQLDIRVSILPTIYGEKMVMRLLSQKQRQFTFEALGFRKEDLRRVREGFMRPHGMILATGPTGSGKTTTLYTILKTLNTRNVNITTIEDPVEYNMDGVNQVQINPRTNLTFAQGLRSILRQDPNIIMVGEIRDEETASIAVNAALTGHLVLSTLHTNDAPTTLPRLLDMNVEPFLVASSVNMAIGQRLVRKICQQCVKSLDLSNDQREIVLRLLPSKSALISEVKRRTRVYTAEGCAVCNGTGFKGRVGIYEVIVMDEAIKKIVVEKASADAIKRAAQERGMTTMLEDGISKVFQGITTIEEVLRVTQE
jgi:type IV pilus assembly protein PilB